MEQQAEFQRVFRGVHKNPSGMTEAIAMIAVQDFLDICFDQGDPGREQG